MMDYGIKVFLEWVSGKGFFLWGSGRGVCASDLKYLLFARHQPSFYGTFIDSSKYQDREGLFISPLTALEFLTTQTWSGEIEWQWSKEIIELKAAAPLLKAALAAGYWKPDYDLWAAGRRGWRLDWERACTTDLPEVALMVPYLEEWASLLVEELIEQDPEIRGAWEKVMPFHPLLLPIQSPGPVIRDEETWLEAVGWREDPAPFRTCLELVEPGGEDSTWRLNIILQDKQDPTRVVPWEPGEQWESSLDEAVPPEWRQHRESIRRQVRKWIEVLPWLEDDGGAKAEEGAGLRRELNEEEAWEFLDSGSGQLVQAGHTVLLPKWWGEVQKLVPALKIRTRSSVGSWKESWLGIDQIVQFDWNLAVGDLELSETDFREIVRKKKRLVQIQGKWFQLDPSYFKKIQQFIRKKERLTLGEILHLRLLGPAASTPAEQEAGTEDDALRVEVELSGQLAQMVEQLGNLNQIPVPEVAGSFRGTLRPYQQLGTAWMLFLRRFYLGCCLADDMGLGKTIQWIAYLLKVREEENPGQPALLICPTSVLGNWQKELARFAPDLKVRLHYGPQRPKGPDFLPSIQGAGVVLTSYNLAHIDEAELSTVEWDCICLDEAQNIKNAYTKQAAAIRRLKGRHRIAMTGTPMENRLTELWSIYDFINPGYLGSCGECGRKFVSGIEKRGDAADISRVQKLIRPFLLRRVKSDPAIELDLPEKQEQKEYIPLTVEQSSLYEGVLQDLFEKLEKTEGMARRGLILSTLSKLKQVCDHPALLLKEEPLENVNDISRRSKKVERLLEMVAQLRQEGERCLVFTQFVRMGRLLQEVLLKELGEPSYYLFGGTPRKERDEMVARFQGTAPKGGDSHNIFILSLKAGGLGLNLTAANHVFHFDRWWNPAVENQATDRSHRIGQNRHVMVHKFITLGTMEERIDELLERKSGLSEQIIGTTEAWLTEFSTSELRELFALRKEWVGV